MLVWTPKAGALELSEGLVGSQAGKSPLEQFLLLMYPWEELVIAAGQFQGLPKC